MVNQVEAIYMTADCMNANWMAANLSKGKNLSQK